MAGFAIGALPYFVQYQGQLQQQEQAKQEQAMRLQAFQQQQAQMRDQQAAQAAAGNAYPRLAMPPPQQAPQFPPQQTPAPGQASQPMIQPGQVPPGSLGPGEQQVNLPPLPPFRPMPTSPPPQQAAQPAAIAPPPAAPAAPPAQGQGGLWSIQDVIKAGQDQGLEGKALFDYMQIMQPVMDTQAKMQAAQLQQQFNNEIKLQGLDVQKGNLQARLNSIEEAKRSHQTNESIRLQLGEQSNALRAQLIELKKQTAAASGGDDAKFSSDDLKFLAEQARAGDTSVYQNLGRGAQGAKNIIALRREVMRQSKEAGETGADVAAANAGFQGEKAAARTAGTKAANVELAVSEAQKTFPIVREASAALPRTQFPGANKAMQAAQTGTGDPRVIALGTAMNTAVNAYARAISPSGTPTVSDKEHARELLNTANTPEQVDAVLKVMEKEMAAARQAPKEVKAAQRERISGKPEAPAAAGGLPAGWTVTEH